MTKKDILSRRKLLGRISLLTIAGYSAPALTTLSMAQAGSGASGGGRNDDNGGRNDDNGGGNDDNGRVNHSTRGSSGGNDDNGGGGRTRVDPNVVEATCGVENLNDPTYLQCLVDNNF